MSLPIEGNINLTPVDEDLNQKKIEVAQATRAMARPLRIISTMTMQTFSALGAGIGVFGALLIESILLTIETIASARIALVAADPMMATIRTVAGIGAISMMLIQMTKIKQHRTESAQETAKWVGVFRTGSYL